MNQLDITSIFYENVAGRKPNRKEIFLADGTIEYLRDNGLSDKEILSLAEEMDAITPENLPPEAWDKSLTRAGVFYFHHELRLVAPPPIVSIDGKRKKEPFYLEMRCRYTAKDLLEYFYKKNHTDPALRNEKRDTGAVEYLRSRYSRVDQVDWLDLVLTMIDYASRSERPAVSLMDIQSFEAEALKNLKALAAEAHKDRADHIIWRGWSRWHTLNSEA